MSGGRDRSADPAAGPVHLRTQLKAGGLVPTSAQLGKDDAVDVVVARAYHHAVLPGRTVIRLTAENVTAGDDLEMSTLGFGPGEDRGAVAQERKRPLGFPGWALVHDPANARYALDVVKEFKKHARKAKSKPGHAKDGIDAIADRLGKTVPHFLPSFYEEAGRVFIEHGAPSFAATMFGKAREAEAVHALEVDEQHRVDGFLEFALAGAVSTKSLGQYAKDLGEHHAPAVAYAHFRQLCVQRTLGGMPPWAGMPKELHRLAKAAKLDLAAEDRAFVMEIIESPALGKAAGEFWRAYQGPLTELGKASAAARGALLNLFPTGTTSGKDLDEAWLDLLDATGATDALIGEALAPEARTSAGRAAWFDKLTAHLARDYRHSQIPDRAFALLRRMAGQLIADGQPITCAGRWSQVDLDLCELALELGVPVAPPAQHPRLDLEAWAKRAREPGHGCDPVRTAAHPTMGPVLAAAVAGEIGDEPFDTESRGKAGFLAAKRAWVGTVIDRAERGGLVGLGEAINLVTTKVKAETFAELPELHARFAALDPAAALARSLSIGLLDELGWPALEEAVRELAPEGKPALGLHGGPPAVILASATRLVAVGAAGRLGTHDLVIPPDHELVTARFIQGQFLVALKRSHKLRGYWSSSPHDLFESEGNVWGLGTLVTHAAVLADGAWIEGPQPLRAGDRLLPETHNLVACDGTTSWISEWKDGKHRWREVSPTGELGRYSRPAFIEAAAEADWQLESSTSYLLPLPGIEASPLGSSDGMVGVRVRLQGDHPHAPARREVTSIDGRTWSGTTSHPTCLLQLPGAALPRLVIEETAWREGVTATLIDPEHDVRGCKIGPKDRRYVLGQAVPLPPTLWHHLTVRDRAGSIRLRATSVEDARALIAGIPVLPTTPKTLATQVSHDVMVRVLPEVTHPRLRDGVLGFAMIAASQLLDRDRVAEERAPGKATAASAGSAGHTDEVLQAGLGGWIDREWGHDGRAWVQLERTAALFASEDHSDRYVHDVPISMVDWMQFAVARSALVFIATAIGTPADKRRAIADLFALIARKLPPADKLRWFTAEGTLELPGDGQGYRPRWYRGNAYAIKKQGYQGHQVSVLEYAPTGVFQPLPGLAIHASASAELRGAPGLGVEALPALEAAIAAGQTSWSPVAAARLAEATGLTLSEATFLWAGCPNISDRSANFLPKELREQLGLKATQAAIARDGLRAVPLARRRAAIEAPARAGLAALLDGSAVDALAEAWTDLVGKRIAIPEELIADADRELSTQLQPAAALALIAGAHEAPELTVDGTWAIGKDGAVIRASQREPVVGQAKVADDSPVFTAAVMDALVSYLPFVFAELPVGHPLRAQAAVAHEAALTRLANPALWLDVGQAYFDPAGLAALERLLDGLGGEQVTGLDGSLTGVRLPCAIVVRAAHRMQLRVQPAALDAKAIEIVGKLVLQLPAWGLTTWRALESLRSSGLAQLMARIRTTPVPEGGWEQDPRASAITDVQALASALDLGEDAAALYLQYLVLLWPTPKNLMQWNGWRPKQLEAATAELVAKELILEAKRERAQRAYFLPGGWEALKSPHPPMESWKMVFYGTRNAGGDPVPPLGRFLATSPFHVLFRAASERISAGDVPRYDEVKR